MPLLVESEPGTSVSAEEDGVAHAARQPMDHERVPRHPPEGCCGPDRQANRQCRSDSVPDSPRPRYLHPASWSKSFWADFSVFVTLLRSCCWAQRNATTKITTMRPSDSHCGISNSIVARDVQVLDEQLDADPRDDDERAVDERRIALDQRQQLPDHQPHRDDAEDAAASGPPTASATSRRRRESSRWRRRGRSARPCTTVAQNARQPEPRLAPAAASGAPRRVSPLQKCEYDRYSR